MTNQEAITKLTNIMHDDHYAWHPSILTAFDMAVDALRGLPSAQPTQNNTSNALKSLDCIDRQAAIDAIKGLEFCQYMEFGEYIGEDPREVRLIRAEKAQDALQKLPSAQPVAKDTNVPINDCISRQGVIDTLNVGAEFLRRVLDETDVVGVEREKYEWGLGLIESYISDMKELPSVQPEIIRCADCSYYKSIKRTDRHQCVNDFVAVIETKPDDFCSRAERRTDEKNT